MTLFLLCDVFSGSLKCNSKLDAQNFFHLHHKWWIPWMNDQFSIQQTLTSWNDFTCIFIDYGCHLWILDAFLITITIPTTSTLQLTAILFQCHYPGNCRGNLHANWTAIGEIKNHVTWYKRTGWIWSHRQASPRSSRVFQNQCPEREECLRRIWVDIAYGICWSSEFLLAHSVWGLQFSLQFCLFER